MTVLGHLPKLKRGLGLAFGAYFLHDRVDINQDVNQDINQNVLLSSYLEN